MKKITISIMAVFAMMSFSYAQFTFPVIAGPESVTAGTGVTLSINDMANTAAVPAGQYGSFTITVDWVAASGGPWSAEAEIQVTTSAGVADVDPPTSGGAFNGTATSLTFESGLAGIYDPSVDGTIQLDLGQSYSGSTADWSNISITLNPFVAPPPPTTDATFNINGCLDSETFNTAYDVNAQPFYWIELVYDGGCFQINLDTAGGDFDTEIGLYNTDGFLIGSNDDDDSLPNNLSLLTLDGLSAGTYYIVAGTFNTEFGANNFDVSTTNTTRTGNLFINASTPSDETADFNNLQFPFEATVEQGMTASVFAQIFEPGITEPAGQGAGIEAWIGVSETDATTTADFTSSDWTWIPATYNTDNGNNDEYQAQIGLGLDIGTYFYVSRFSIQGGPFTYGGINPGGSDGNSWDGMNFVSGELTVVEASPPANDECEDAIALTINSDLSCESVTSGSTVAATASSQEDDVTGTPDNDVWFSFTADSENLIISLINITAVIGTSTDMGMGVYDLTGGCSGLVLVDDSDPNTLSLSGLTIGNDYVLRVYGWSGTTSAQTVFDVCVRTTPAPPANDECQDAIALTVNEEPDLNCAVVTAGTTVSATASVQDDDVTGTPNNDVWYTFVASAVEHRIQLLNVTAIIGTSTDMGMGVYDLTGGCDGLVLVDDSDPNTLNLSDLVVGNTYSLRIYGWSSSVSFTAQANFDICISTPCTADAGSLNANSDTVQLVGADVTISATEDDSPVVPTNYETSYVLTSGPDLVIEAVSAMPSFDVDSAGDYTIHTLVAETTDNTDPDFLDLSVVNFGSTEAADVLNIVTTNDICASLDVTGAPVTVEMCNADAGSLTADSATAILSNGTATLTATENVAPTVPTDYEITYVLTSGANLVIEAVSDMPSFEVDSPGDFRIHTLVAETSNSGNPSFLDLSVVNFGVNEAQDVLDIVTTNELCAALDTAGALITVEDCTALAGTLIADLDTVQLAGADVVISATEDTAPTVPADYDVSYVLTSGTDLVIEAVNSMAMFTVDAAGDYRIHTLVAETTDNASPDFLDLGVVVFGTTEAADVLGTINDNSICAALDVNGAPVTVETCSADAGTLTADVATVQLSGADVAISATEDTAPTVPANYDVLYVLTMGTDLTIMGTNATPDFTVTAAGDYTIHTLVAELDDTDDPNYVDLGALVTVGTTTGVDVVTAITDNGLCADLLVMGAEITVEACGADAGTLTADFTPVQLSGADVAISATEDTAPTVPADYDVLYVLTMGTDLTIMGTNTTPDFTVTAAGDYTIHTLVAELDDTDDPNYVDLAALVTVGTTTGVDVVTAITDNGLCADLLVMGAEITVEACSADAGTLTADLATVQLAGADVAISATEDTAPTVPADYDVLYVLTMGTDLTIMGTNATADFTVTAAGDYTIHTLVAELDDTDDPNYVDLAGLVTVGTTTGVDVVTAITNNGLCADLLVMGAEITVEACSANAGTLTADVTPVSLMMDEATISATEDVAPTIPANYEVVYVLTMGTDLTIMDTNATPEFTVTVVGDYTIHTLVAELDDANDPNFLDVSVIVPGTTTGVDVVNIINDANNPLCADLLVMGAEIEVDDSLSNDAFTSNNFSYYPNPIENELHFRAQSQIDNVTIFNMLGQEVMSVSPMALEADLDTSSIAAGTYFARVTIGNASKTIKVIKE